MKKGILKKVFMVLGIVVISILAIVYFSSSEKNYQILDLRTKEDSIKFFANTVMLGDKYGNIIYKNKKFFPDSILSIDSDLNGKILYRLKLEDSVYQKEIVFKPEDHTGKYYISFRNDTIKINDEFIGEIKINSRFVESSSIYIDNQEKYKIQKVRLEDGIKYIYKTFNYEKGINIFSGRVKIKEEDKEFIFKYFASK